MAKKFQIGTSDFGGCAVWDYHAEKTVFTGSFVECYRYALANGVIIG